MLDANTITIAGGSGFATTVSATDTVTVDFSVAPTTGGTTKQAYIFDDALDSFAWVDETTLGVSTIGELTDVANALGTAGQILQVNAGGTALEYVAPAAGTFDITDGTTTSTVTTGTDTIDFDNGFTLSDVALVPVVELGGTITKDTTFTAATFDLNWNSTTGGFNAVASGAGVHTISSAGGSINLTETTGTIGITSTTGDITVGASGTGNLLLQGDMVQVDGGTGGAEMRFLEPSASGVNYVSFSTPILAANTTYTFPDALPTANGQVMSSTTAGVMSWATPLVSQGIYDNDTAAGVGLVAIGEMYELSSVNTYGESTGVLKIRRT